LKTKIYIDNDLTKERDVQGKLREIARGERIEGRRVRVGYRKIEIKAQLYVKNEEENKIVKKKNFEGQPRNEEDGSRRERWERRGENIESKNMIKIVFWNIAELKRKDRDFWEYLES